MTCIASLRFPRLVMFLILLRSATTTETQWIQTGIIPHKSHDRYGSSVAIDDGILVVGAYENNYVGRNAGAAFIYVFVDGKWSREALLTASDAARLDYFGKAVAVSDGIVAVGACGDDNQGVHDAGAVYVYVRGEAGSWTKQAKLIASDGGRWDRLGESLAIQGETLIAGAAWDDDQGPSSGSVYVFKRIDGSWTEQSKLTASDGIEGDYFGNAVSIYGDWLVVGSPYDDDVGDQSGSAYLFHQVADGSWTEHSKLTARDGHSDDNFGLRVGIFDDTVVVYSKYHRGGAVYHFVLSSEAWTEQAVLVAGDPSIRWFGWSLALAEGRLVVGAVSEDGRGQVILFASVDGSWTEQSHLTANGTALANLHSPVLALDGQDTLVVGSPSQERHKSFVAVFSASKEPTIRFQGSMIGLTVAMLLTLILYLRGQCYGRRQRADLQVYDRMESCPGDDLELTPYQLITTEPLLMSHHSFLQHRHRQV